MKKLLLLLLLLLTVGCANTPQPTPIAIPLASAPRDIIVDTDVSVDDILALLYLLSRPDVNVRAITIAGTGITRCDAGIRNVRAILETMERTTIPIACGRETPLQGKHAFPNEWRDGAENFFGVNLQPSAFLTPNENAAALLTRWFALAPFLLVLVLWFSEILHTTLIADDRIPWLALILLLLGLLLLVTWSQIYRYRHVSTRAQQTQTRLVVLALVSMVTTLTCLFTLSILSIPFGVSSIMDSPPGAFASFLINNFVMTLLPLAFGVAMLRDQLWQSERALNRAFVYFALTAILLIVYVLIIAFLSELFRATNNFLVAAIATGVVALLFQPLRARLQRGVNRFLYGQRDEPFCVLNQLGAQLEHTLTPEAALPLIVETIGKNLRVPYAAIALSDEGRGLRTEYGKQTQSSVLVTFPLKYQNETVGELVVARRAANESFSPADLQLLENLARHAGAVVYTARLNAQLQQSRERIIVERENERRRLRRDLHDGLGPTLAGQTLKLDAAMELLDDEKGETKHAREILLQLKAQTQNTVAEIRRIVYELRPPALDDLGLVGALRAHLAQSHAANGLQLSFDVPDELPPLSAAVQVNAYRIVMEAVHNVVRHANATRCVVRIVSNGDLRLEIQDDGIGLTETHRTGIGLTSMRERAEELGGTFKIQAANPKGTRVTATLPLSIGNRKSEIGNRKPK